MFLVKCLIFVVSIMLGCELVKRGILSFESSCLWIIVVVLLAMVADRLVDLVDPWVVTYDPYEEMSNDQEI